MPAMHESELDTDIQGLLEAEEAGRERRSNQLRLVILVLFLSLFLVYYLRAERHYVAGYIILLDMLTLLTYSLVLAWLLRKGRYHRVIKFVSFGADLTGITIILLCSLFLSRGTDPAGWMAAAGVFFLFIALTSLRFAPRLCFFMGFVAAGEFLFMNQFTQASGGQAFPLPQAVTIAIVMIATGLVLAASAYDARRLVVRIGLAERERVHLESAAERANRLANVDELTGLYNRRYFLEQLRHQALLAVRHGRTFALLAIDVDHFKEVNDRLGHQAGDAVLRQIAAALRQQLRLSDLVARVGGDEFAVLLYEADAASAEASARRLCEAVRAHTFAGIADPAGPRPTLSIGVACFPGPARDVDELLVAADRALYDAKGHGRDRVAMGTAPTAAEPI